MNRSPARLNRLLKSGATQVNGRVLPILEESTADGPKPEHRQAPQETTP